MIDINNIDKDEPFELFQSMYELARKNNQKNIEAICISSYSKLMNMVDSRFVNIKLIEKTKFIFFTNYDSPKALQFDEHSQISAVFFWNQINCQIRIKAKIKKCNTKFSDNYFKKRSLNKNALAISSDQSKEIDSFENVIKNYNLARDTFDLKKRPSYWGGYEFSPYYFEFWRGNENRLNSRIQYQLFNKKWNKVLLQP